MDDAGEAFGLGLRQFRVRQRVIRRQEFVEAHTREVGDARNPFGAQRPGEAEGPTLDHVGRAFAKKRGAAVGRGRNRCGKGQLVGVHVQKAAPNVWK